MTKKIKLDIIADIVCPWCVIGYKQLEAAINELNIQDKVDIEWQPFELNPDIPAEGENLQQYQAKKFDITPDKNQQIKENITQQGAEYGFEFNYFDGMKIVNTLDLHILLDYAKDLGKQTELKMRLFQAYFSEQKDLSDKKVLIRELNSLGLDGEQAIERLNNKSLHKDVQEQEAYWLQLGITSVPTLVFNHTKAITGAQSVETYKQILKGLL